MPHTLLAATAMTQEGLTEQELTYALENAERARLLSIVAEDASAETLAQPMDSAHAIRYQFVHDLAREAILADLVPAKQVALHRAVAEAIERLPESGRWIAELADHFTHAGELGRALPYALLAGDQGMAIYAHGNAERHYRAASELAQEVGDQQQEAAALERLARVLYILKRLDEALDTIAEGIAVYGALGDVEGEARMAWLLGWAHIGHGTSQEGIARLMQLIADLRKRGFSPRADVWLQLVLSVLCDHIGRGEYSDTMGREALTRAGQIAALARTARDPTLLTEALGIIAKIALTLGDTETALLALEEVVMLDAPTVEAWNQAEALTIPVYAPKTLAIIYTLCGMFARSGPLYKRAFEEAIRAGNIHNLRSVYTARGRFAFFIGDWAQARNDWEQAEDVMRKVEGLADEASLYLFLLSVAEGQAETESAEVKEQLARSAKEHNHSLQCVTQVALAEREVLEGRFDAARDRLQSLLDEYRAELDEDDMIPVLTQLAWACLHEGEATRVEEEVAANRSRVEAYGYDLLLIDILRVEALIHMEHHRWQEAEAELDEALRRTRAMPYPYAEAKTLWVYGQLEDARGNPVASRERFMAALAICDQLGERMYAARIEHELETLKARMT